MSSTDSELKHQLVARAERGDIEAMYELGWRSALGLDLPEDEEEAVKWLREAAARGHMLACNNLGARYVSGEGVPVDRYEAYKWFHLAAEKGDRKAGKNRDAIAAEMSPEQLAEARRRAGQE
ncbi:MAG: tetratricopeptide repeat protein [Verrucomicrobiota bacterium]